MREGIDDTLLDKWVGDVKMRKIRHGGLASPCPDALNIGGRANKSFSEEVNYGEVRCGSFQKGWAFFVIC